MKFFPQVLVTISAVLSVASAADLGSQAVAASSSMATQVALTTESKTKTQTRRLDDGEPWDNGTKVYNEFPNEGWWSGTITNFSTTTGMYTVMWEDGSTDYYDDGDKIDQMVAYAQNDPLNNPAGASDAGAYPTGTAVSVYEDGEWYDGVVIEFGSNSYTVKWDEDDEIEQIPSGAIMDQMVQASFGDDDAPPDGHDGGPSESASVSVGTPVSYYEEGEWSDGQVTGYSSGVYTVKWEDGSTNQYADSGDDMDELNQAALDANGDDDAPPVASDSVSGPKFANGTPVSDWEDGEWVDGIVINFQDGKYLVRWEDEDDVEFYDSHNSEDMQELGSMVEDGTGDDDAPPASFFAEEDLWEIGTPVAVTEDDIIWYGEIDGFRQGEYSIAWENGESEYLDNFDLVNTMVSNAALSPKYTGMGAVGKTFLSFFIIAVGAAGAVFGYKFYVKQQAVQKRERDLVVEDGSDPSYRDQPDYLPKII
jgi:hypothetical protein